MEYLCTYGSGWEKAIKIIMESKYSGLKIRMLENGIIVFESKDMINPKDFFFFNNVYLLLREKKCNSTIFDKNVNDLINGLKLDYNSIRKNIEKLNNKSFKIISIMGNQPCKINYNSISNLERDIQNNLRIKVSKEKHDLDFVFMQRTEGIIYFLLKLSYNRTTERNLEQGSLRPEVAYLLSSLANIKETDIVLDPFTGSGAIPKEIIKRFKYNMLFASDIDEEKYISLKNQYKGNNKKFYIKNFDALNMPFFKDGFIDAVVTDPPWNIYEHENKDYTEFYYAMLTELDRIVKPGGSLVILMGNEEEFEKALNRIIDLELRDKLSVLINGKKAKVYVLKR